MGKRLLKVSFGAAALLGLAMLNSTAAYAQLKSRMAINIENHSVETKCAEVDNIYYTFRAPAAPAIGGFRVEAIGARYLPLTKDSTAPDFTDCSFGEDIAAIAHPDEPATLYENDQYILKGIVYSDFWRQTTVPVKVGKLTKNLLRIVQLWKKTDEGPVEFLVFYPQDGYWRLKTLPPNEMREVAYGSSFLLGPIETSERPFVAYKSVTFDPKAIAFTIEFAKGGTATVTVADIRTNHAALDVTFDHVSDGGQGIASLRSMYVSPARSDTAEIRWKAADSAAPQVSDIIAFKSAAAVAVTFGRSVPSRHNTSAPDIAFSAFLPAGGQQPPAAQESK
jgi:hypothetical protein